MDTRLALMTGVDIPIPECGLSVHQPTIKEISYIGEKDFFIGAQTLTLHKKMFIQDESVLDNISNFQIFMKIIEEEEMAEKKKSVSQLFTLLFPDYKVMFTPQSLLFSKPGSEMTIVDENNFDFLQDVLREIFCSKTGLMDQQSFNPANAKAKEIADKLMRGRQRVAAQKGTANVSVFSLYTSILSIGLTLPITEVVNYTMFQIYDLVERYSLYISWDLDVRTRLAGGKPDSQPENWMKNIH